MDLLEVHILCSCKNQPKIVKLTETKSFAELFTESKKCNCNFLAAVGKSERSAQWTDISLEPSTSVGFIVAHCNTAGRQHVVSRPYGKKVYDKIYIVSMNSTVTVFHCNK